jgi:central glycolytic genes regulator
MNKDLLSLLQQLAPDLMEKLMLRAQVLERISALQPVGRRALAQRLHMPEREIRSVCDALKEDGLISVAASGMAVTDKALAILPGARDMVVRKSALGQLEQHLARALNVRRLCIVPGDADLSPESLTEVGRAAAERLVRLLSDGMILTVSGGTTVAAVARAMHSPSPMNIRVLPARGGMGMAVETQAGTLAAEFAHALGGTYSLVHLPDSVPPETLRELMKLPEIGEPLRALQQTDVLLYGVGRADVMARNRLRPESEIASILRMGAVGEAVGCYFDASGRPLFQASGVGLTCEQVSRVRCIVAVAAGASKARAILSVLKHHHHELLVIDEGAARAIEKLL